VRVTTGEVDRISFDDSTVYVSLAREDIKRANAGDVAVPANVPHGAVRVRE
jgi:predicted nucleotidyltransferase